MKKSLLTIALCATALASATAQTKIEGSYVKFDPIEMNGKEIPVMGSFHKVSPNGQWAVGSDDSGQVGWSFIYSVADDKLTTLEDPSVTELYYIVADVANDGTMVGAYTNDAGEIVPGIRKSADSEWEPLPVPEDHMPAHSSASGFSSARAINGDLRIAIKADATTPYSVIKNVMNSLQDLRENRYNLITTLKTTSEE